MTIPRRRLMNGDKVDLSLMMQRAIEEKRRVDDYERRVREAMCGLGRMQPREPSKTP